MIRLISLPIKQQYSPPVVIKPQEGYFWYLPTAPEKAEAILINLQALIADLRDCIAWLPSLDNAETLPEFLFYAYKKRNRFDNEVVRRDFNMIYAIVNGTALWKIDEILCILCRDCERPCSRKMWSWVSNCHYSEIKYVNIVKNTSHQHR